MLKIYLGNVARFVKRSEFVITGPVFNLCTKFTTFLLLIFAVVMTTAETWSNNGKPIICKLIQDMAKNVHGDKDLEKVVNTFCWIDTTYLASDAFSDLVAARRSGHPGMATNHHGVLDFSRRHYAYYQWVVFALFFQAWLCYLPWYFWKHTENGLMRCIVCGLKLGKMGKADELEKNKVNLVKYLVMHLNLHSTYTMCYWTAEFFCLVSIVSQMIFLDWFFDGEFIRYGFNVFGLFQLDEVNSELRFDPFIYVFPRVTQCVFRRFGPTNSIDELGAICVLSLNHINEKIYIFVWFWYGILAFLTCGLILYRILIIISPCLRQRLLHSRNRMVSLEAASLISKNSASDWWIFYMLGRNLDPARFTQVAEEFAKQSTALTVAANESKNV